MGGAGGGGHGEGHLQEGHGGNPGSLDHRSARRRPYPRGRVPFTQGLSLDKIGAETDRRGFVPVTDKMEVVGKDGKPVPNVYCIGDANGKYMLAHAASAQGISAIENIKGRSHVLNHLSVPAACFTHPEVSFVGLTEEHPGRKQRRRSS